MAAHWTAAQPDRRAYERQQEYVSIRVGSGILKVGPKIQERFRRT